MKSYSCSTDSAIKSGSCGWVYAERASSGFMMQHEMTTQHEKSSTPFLHAHPAGRQADNNMAHKHEFRPASCYKVDTIPNDDHST